MRAKDVFGIVLRTLGVICLIWAALDGSTAISMATSFPVNTWGASILTSHAIVFIVVGLVLLLGTKVIIRLAYDKEN